ncbi:zinc-ribbon and DUF3426 domain-containing protein [Cupriavidus basilensis]|uniref:Zinc-ribbon domain-containing protein n=1 Tax=Cupriavidus basilensis TaxID=68895 RepID=A0A643FT27_9BURK|nr:zinc-ribbon and DUF3426 domain-containing protein [Cupriavidus basilensis]QOT75961.1 zinc-ribbon domain-containing protein [Cupriavidus basilensis]
MAAAKLVTRCPACRTAFRLVPDQLRLRQGLVRCGQCDTVFDAREHLIELPAPEPAAGPEAVAQAGEGIAAPVPASPPAQEAHPVEATAVLQEAAHFDTFPQHDADDSRPAAAPFDPGYDPGYDVPALDAPTVMLYQTQTEADEAVQASNHRAEPETGTADAHEHKDEDKDEPSAVFVPGIVESESEEAGLTAPAAEVEAAEAPQASEAPAPAPEAAPWPQLDPSTLGADDATHTADITDTENAADTGKAANEASAASTEADAAAIPSAGGYLRAQAQDDFPEIPEAISREQAERPWMRSDTPATPSFAPDFLRHARERDPGPAKRKRMLQKLAIGFLVIAGLLQGTFLARSQLSGRFPVLRPAFEAACAPLGCEVAPWRDIDALRIESSLLQKQDDESDAYLLAVTLRNQGRATVALPAIELVMTDLQDQLLLRRVLQPADYLETGQQAFATHGLRAGTELPVRVRFRSQQAAANYRVLIFYP